MEDKETKTPKKKQKVVKAWAVKWFGYIQPVLPQGSKKKHIPTLYGSRMAAKRAYKNEKVKIFPVILTYEI